MSFRGRMLGRMLYGAYEESDTRPAPANSEISNVDCHYHKDSIFAIQKFMCRLTAVHILCCHQIFKQSSFPTISSTHVRQGQSMDDAHQISFL
jgi:hypothetical protein